MGVYKILGREGRLNAVEFSQSRGNIERFVCGKGVRVVLFNNKLSCGKAFNFPEPIDRRINSGQRINLRKRRWWKSNSLRLYGLIHEAILFSVH